MTTRGQVRVLLYISEPHSEPAAVEKAYHAISNLLADAPGLLGNELLRSLSRPSDFAVMSSWAGVAAFQAWEQTSEHRQVTAPMRPYQSEPGGSFGIYEVVGSYGREPEEGQ